MSLAKWQATNQSKTEQQYVKNKKKKRITMKLSNVTLIQFLIILVGVASGQRLNQPIVGIADEDEMIDE